MKKIYTLLFSVALAFGANAQTNVGITGNVAGVYINEFHYDNAGTDVGEFIEVAGPSGTDLSTYTITLYNGNNNTSYFTLALSGVIDDEGNGVGAVSFLFPDGIQNGAPDAIALSKTNSTSIQYLSYEGTMSATATDGAALGLSAVDILVAEIATEVGSSLEYDEASSTWINISAGTPGTFAQGVLSIKQNQIEGLKIYPNPVTNGTFYINTNADTTKEVVVYDVLGKQVVKTSTTNAVNVSNLKGGVYIVKITEDGKTATRKLVIK
ncbi:T9SS type A sorting domain-containing protein [Flavobacterium sp. SM2513]|uniref:T9SS type A sorting domain-containing protein n=1 Tax=Flavobacterium sp. SM2513 TaxID=3424766 RepID=UPI003D7FC6F8